MYKVKVLKTIDSQYSVVLFIIKLTSYISFTVMFHKTIWVQENVKFFICIIKIYLNLENQLKQL
jgi:hypothetical protein